MQKESKDEWPRRSRGPISTSPTTSSRTYSHPGTSLSSFSASLTGDSFLESPVSDFIGLQAVSKETYTLRLVAAKGKTSRRISYFINAKKETHEQAKMLLILLCTLT